MADSETLLMRIELTSGALGSIDVRAGLSIVRFNQDTHAAAARELLNAAYRNDGGDTVSLAQWWPNLIADPEFDHELLFVLIEESPSEMLAFAQIWSSGFIKDFAVHPPAQCKGIECTIIHIIYSIISIAYVF